MDRTDRPPVALADRGLGEKRAAVSAGRGYTPPMEPTETRAKRLTDYADCAG
jgi:hypothetical protein